MICMRTLVVLIICVAVATMAEDATIETDEKKAAIRLLQASLSCSGADNDAIRSDAHAVFGKILGSEVLDDLFENSSLTSRSCEANQSTKTQQFNIPKSVERHSDRAEAALVDFDCMEREFDLSDPSFDTSEAAKVLSKCRLLVLRNIWSEDLIFEFKANFSNYLTKLHQGKISRSGTTTLGEQYFLSKRNPKRFDILLPKYLKHDEIHINRIVSKILRYPQVLGKDFIVNSIGAVISETGAPSGSLHYDDEYLLDFNSFREFSLAGADLPPWAVTMFFPIRNMTEDQGPTEFCIGTTHVRGLLDEEREPIDEAMHNSGKNFKKLLSIDDDHRILCPKEFIRTPKLNVGDAVFFDFTITHRGGSNRSPDLRAMPYTYYSRYWYRDSNFEPPSSGLTFEQQRTVTSRFAQVKELEDCKPSPCPDRVPLESIRNFLNPIRQVTLKVFNEDVDDAALYVGKTLVSELKVGQSVAIDLPSGTMLKAYDKEKTLLKKWKVPLRQKSIILRMEDMAMTS